MKRHFFFIAVIVSVFVGCATTTISSDYDRSVDFSKLKTYTWAPEQKPTGDLRFDDPELRAVIKQSIEADLEEKGFQKKTVGEPDLFVKYYITVEKKKEPLGDYYPPIFNSRTGTVDMSMVGVRELADFTYEDGTFVLDMLAPTTNKILWRGTLEGMVDPGGTSEKRKTRAPDAVAKVLAKFPPVKK